MRNGFHKEMWGGGIFSDNLQRAFNTFLPPAIQRNKSIVKRLTRDIVDCYIRYGSTPAEYFLYDFPHTSEQKRDTFATNIIKDKACMKVIGLDRFQNELCDKFFFYQKMKRFFRREAVLVRNLADKQSFLQLACRASRLFAKPLTGSYGSGARLLTLKNTEDSSEAFSSLLETKNEWIVEECITQSPEMAVWNPDSVNTL